MTQIFQIIQGGKMPQRHHHQHSVGSFLPLFLLTTSVLPAFARPVKEAIC